MVAFADTVFTIMSLNNTYHTGSWADWGWSFGWMLVGYAFLLPTVVAGADKRAGDTPGGRPPAAGWRSGCCCLTWPPLVPSASSVCMTTTRRPLHQIDTSTLASGLALILLVIARQVFTLLENQQLTTQVRLANERLEETVDQRTHQLQQRTRQLAALHHLTKAINTTLDFDKVLTEALREFTARRRCRRRAHPAARHPRKQMASRGSSGSPASTATQRCWTGSRRCRPARRWRSCRFPQTSDSACGRALTCEPRLQWQDQTLGTIGFVRWQNGFEDTELELVESIAWKSALPSTTRASTAWRLTPPTGTRSPACSITGRSTSASTSSSTTRFSSASRCPSS